MSQACIIKNILIQKSVCVCVCVCVLQLQLLFSAIVESFASLKSFMVLEPRSMASTTPQDTAQSSHTTHLTTPLDTA